MSRHWIYLVSLLGTLMMVVMPTYGEIVHTVVDGDTLILENGRRIHLLGIDAPELGSMWGERARAYLAQRVEKKAVTLLCEDDDASHSRCRVLRHDSDVGLEMLWEGLAKQKKPPHLYRYSDYEGQAKGKDLGVWSD